MDSDNILTFALIGVGGYAVYKIFSNSGVGKTTDAIGDIAQSGSNLITTGVTTTEKIFKTVTTDNPFFIGNIKDTAKKAEDTIYSVGKSGVDYLSNNGGLVSQVAPMPIINYSAQKISSGGLLSQVSPIKAITSFARFIAPTPAIASYGTPTTALASYGSPNKPMLSTTTSAPKTTTITPTTSAGGKGIFKGATVKATIKPKYSKPY